MREPLYFWDDSHLAELIRDAERARPWYARIDWGPILGGLIVIGISTVAWWAIIQGFIWASGWYQ